MSAFLFLLVKLNLAMGTAILLVALLRRPLRALFGATIAYAIWLLVPIAGIACLFPPRVGAPVTLAPVSAAPVSAINHIADSALRVTEQLTGQGPLPAITVPSPATTHAMPDTVLLLFAGWAVGMLLMASYLIWLQLRFSAAMRRGEAGPAVLGFLRSRIVTPDNFQEHFTPQEQAAILAHERVHLVRQDARVNALAALLRCLCWFNPFIHLGAHWLRIDQELACDATVVAGAIPRQTYAEALLKSQMMVASLPLGCNWPGPQHPLIERIVLLKRQPPGAARRLAGVSLVMVAATSAGLGAWAAQPPGAAKPAAARHPGSALATLAAPSAAPNTTPSAMPAAAPAQTARDTGLNPLAAEANPTSSGREMDTSREVHAEVLPVPARVQAPSADRIQAQMEPTLAGLPQIASVSEPLNSAGDTASGAPLVAKTEPVVMPNTPSGVGDPDTTVCRAPQRIAGSDQFGPQVCLHNYEWWKVAMDGKDVTPDGKTLIARPIVDKSKKRVMTAHAETAAALTCLLNHVPDRCKQLFAGHARLQLQFWRRAGSGSIELGPLVSSEYAGTESPNVYTTRTFGGRTADVYYVRFRSQNTTFYIAPPGPDGEIRYIRNRSGAPDDENEDLFVRGPA